MYFDRNGERVSVRGIKDLIRGDKVYATTYDHKYVPVTVARVRTVECATIVTIKKHEDISTTRFVGYHTACEASGDSSSVLTMYRYSADRMQRALEQADQTCDKIAARADALYALRVLRNWLSGSDEQVFKDFEL